jgi:putative ABC transport system ATP-binding protein
VIELEGIGRRFDRAAGAGGPVHALVDVSLRIARGEFVAVVGPSGSGKSTLLAVLGALDRPTAGRYTFDGEEVAALGAAGQARFRNRRIGFVFQSFHLMPRTTALENVELPLVYSDRASIAGLGRRALEAVGLADRMRHTPGELSGGQQQRVAIARALVNEPDLLLADEPTGNLDPASAAEVMALFEALHRAGRTVVLVTHDMAMAARAERVVRIEGGRVVADERAARPAVPAALAAGAS